MTTWPAPISTTGALPIRPATRPLLLISGVAYSLSWVLGLFVVSSSTEVRSSGTQILHSYTGHQAAVALQYVLTEGLPAVFLAVVTSSLACAISRRATMLRRVVLAAGLSAATISLAQLALALWLTIALVSNHDPATAGTVFRALNRLDGVKMLLLAVVALAAMRAIQRRHVTLPNWLAYTAATLAVTITLSAIGYLALDNTLAMTAWLSLPCLLVFVTGTGSQLSHRHTAHRR